MKVACGVTLRLPQPPLLLGEAVDLSVHGIGVLTARPIRSGTTVTVSLDIDILPDVEGTELTATVVGSRRDDDGLYRLGLLIGELPDDLIEYVRDVATPTSMVIVNEESLPVGTGPSREALYQAAWTRLEARHYEAALLAAQRALAGDPANRFYRALVWRAAAELHLARGHCGEAYWDLLKAQAYAPSDPHIRSLIDTLRA